MVHLQDYDLDTVHQITRTPKDLLVRWARDSGTIKPAAIHNGEGVCHYFHMTEMGRAAALVMTLTGNVGKFGTGLSYLVRQLQGGHLDCHALVRGGLGGAHRRRSVQHHSRSQRARQGNQDRNPTTTAKKSATGTMATRP